MANNPVVGRMRIELAADSATLEDGLKEASARFSKFAGNVAKIAAGMGLSLAGVATAVGVAVAGSIRELEKMQRAADAIGLPIQQLSALRHAAEETGTSFESLSAGMSSLAQKLVEASSNARSGAAQAFNAIGVGVTDANGRLRSTEAVLNDVADAFERMGASSTRSTAAARLFGGAAAEMTNFLQRGSFEINQLTGQAANLGLVLDERTTAAAERLSKAMGRSGDAFNSLANRITIRLTPVLEHVADLLERIAGTAVATAPSIGQLEEHMAKLTARAAELNAVLADPKAHAETVANAERQLALIRQRIAETELLLDLTRQQQDITARGFQTEVHPAAPGFENQEEAMRRRAELQERLNYLVAYGNQLDAEGRMIKESLMGPHEQLIATQERLSELLRAGAIDASTFGHAMERATLTAASAYTGMAAQVGNALQQLFGKSKIASVASAVMNVANGITQALTLPFPLNWAQAAAVAASGAAQIATIKRTNLGSGGSAPSVRRGGGGGGGAGSEAAPAQSTPSQTLTVQGIDSSSIFTGDTMRSFAERLLQFQRDGGKVVLAR